jgi:hypothetical protein
MEINARVISGLDPGAIPGGSTNFFPVIAGKLKGPISIDRRVKTIAFSRYGTAVSGHFLNANDNFAEEVRLAA